MTRRRTYKPSIYRRLLAGIFVNSSIAVIGGAILTVAHP